MHFNKQQVLNLTRKILIITGVCINIILFANSLSAVFIKNEHLKKEIYTENSTEKEKSESENSFNKLFELDKISIEYKNSENPLLGSQTSFYTSQFIYLPLTISEITTPPPEKTYI